MAKLRSRTFHVPGRGERWTANDAKAALEECAKSRLSTAAFAREHGFDPQRLYWWRRRGIDATHGNIAPVSFEEVDLAAVGTGEGGDGRFEIELSSGCVVRVPSSFEENALRRLLAVVRADGAAC
jgi:transposase-like protein